MIAAALWLSGCLHGPAPAPAASPGPEPAPEPAPEPEPSWVQVIDLPPTAAPADPCTTTLTLPPPPDRPRTPPVYDMTGWLTIAPDLPVPPGVLPRLQPPDLSALPIPPIQGDPALLADLRARIAQASHRKVRIGVWGDSHTAPDQLTGTARALLQSALTDGGHGYVMPVTAWKGYRAEGLSVCGSGRWTALAGRTRLPGPGGLLLAAGEAGASGWVQTPPEPPDLPAGGRPRGMRLELWFVRQPGGGRLEAQVDGAPPVTVSTAGDGPGALVFRTEAGAHRLRVTALDGPSGAPGAPGAGGVLLAGAAVEYAGAGLVLDSMGINGQRLAGWRAWDSGAMRAWAERRPWEVMVLEYGSNDGARAGLTPEGFRQEADSAIRAARLLQPEAACLIIGPSDRGWRSRDPADPATVLPDQYVVWQSHRWINDVLRDLAPQHGCLSWSLQEAMGGEGSMLGWYRARLLQPDLIHFTLEGATEIGRRWVQAMYPVNKTP